MATTLDQLDACSLIDTMKVSCPSQEQSETDNSFILINEIGLHEFYKLIGDHPPESAEKEGGRDTGNNRQSQQPEEVENEKTEPPAKRRKKTVKRTFGTLEAFIYVLESSLKDLEKNELQVYKRGNRALTDRPNDPKVRPDVAIFRRDNSLSHEEDQLSWDSVEMAIEYHSAEKTRDQCIEQVDTYFAYLLRARPDMVSALGLLVEPDSLEFFFCNTDEVSKLSLSKKEDYLPLLSAVMKYLNGGQKKNLDSTLSRVPGTVLFDVSIPNGCTSLGVSQGPSTLYESCSLRCSHDPFGRRSSVFVYEPKNDVTAIRIIKDQYIRKNRSWIEKDILAKIHASGTYPAVVRMCFFGEITQARCRDHIRVRICLQDYGTDFLSLKTPREVIYALYDLLEVTRGLYSDRKILHRDISPWNIIIRDSRYTQDVDTCSSASPVFIQHLLDPEIHEHRSSIFLIDFGYSQDLDSSEPRSDGRTGTPVFIARAVQAGKPLYNNRSMMFPKLPPLSGGIKAVYESKHPKRMESFKETLGLQIGPSKNPLPAFFQHKLDHDGESGVWSFFWWCILAFPENETQVPISVVDWAALLPQYDGDRTGLPNYDMRDTVLHSFIDRKKVLHPGYGGLLDLCQSIAYAIFPDYHWAEGGVRQLPDFVHEILQRIILNFVVENKDAPFMDKKKANKNRKVHGISTGETDSHRASSWYLNL